MTYEILTISNPEATEKAQKDLSQKIEDLVKKEKGKPISQQNLGTKKLAAPIENYQTGTYFSIVAELEPESLKGIKKSLAASPEIINVFIFKTVQPETKKVKQPKPKKKALEAKPKKKVSKISKIEKPEKIKIKPKKKPVKPEPKSEITTDIEGEQDRLKKLDEKLDEILKE